MNPVFVLNRIIRYSFYLLFIVVPFIVTPWNYELFEFNKMLAAYALTIIIVSTWMVKMAVTRTISIRRTPLDIPLLLFLASQLISSLFSIDPHVSWFGYYSRFNGGMLSIFTYVLLYYAFVSNFGEKEDNKPEPALTHNSLVTLLFCALGTAVLVSLYGILQRLGIDKDLWVQDVQNRVFSTLGQPNWMAAYLAALLPLPFAFLYISQQKKTSSPTWQGRFIAWSVIAVTFFAALLFTKSRSGFLGFAAALGVFKLGTFFFAQSKKAFVQSIAVPGVLFFLLMSFFGTGIDRIDKLITVKSWQQRLSAPQTQQAPQPSEQEPAGATLMEFGGTESGKIRTFVWQAALAAWRSSQKAFLIGTGTETFAFAFFQYKPMEHNLTSEWDFLYNKAHNEYLNYLATTGIIGLGSYLFLLAATIFWFIYYARKHNNQIVLPLALFSGWLSLLITNFFGFSVVIIQLFLFLIPAMLFVLLQKDSRKIHIQLSRLPTGVSIGFGFTGLLIAVLCLGYISVYWIADRFYATGFRESRQGLLAKSYKSLTQAVLLRPSEPVYYDELSVVLSGISVASMEAGSATDAASFARESLAASEKALSISPKNVNFWKSRTKIYFGFSQVNEDFTKAAIDSLEKALALSPSDPKITYNLAVLYGRLGQNEQAIELLKQTIKMKPNYRDAFYALYVFYLEVKQPNLARSVLEEYLTVVDPNDVDFKERLASPNPTTLP